MPRHYQTKKLNPYRLPHNIYMQMIYIVRDYDRMMRLADGERDQKAAMRVEAVDRALLAIFPEYRKGVFQYVARGRPFPIIAGIATWKRHQQKFIWYVAHYLGEA